MFTSSQLFSCPKAIEKERDTKSVVVSSERESSEFISIFPLYFLSFHSSILSLPIQQRKCPSIHSRRRNTTSLSVYSLIRTRDYPKKWRSSFVAITKSVQFHSFYFKILRQVSFLLSILFDSLLFSYILYLLIISSTQSITAWKSKSAITERELLTRGFHPIC